MTAKMDAFTSGASITVRDWRDEDEAALVGLARREDSAAETANAAFFDWLYRRNPAGRAVIACAEAEGAIVGMVANVPLPLARAGVTVPACQSVNVLTDSRYRGQGLFVRCARHACDRSIAEGRIVLGFPNAAALPGWRKLGHRELGVPAIMAYVLRPSVLAFQAAFGRTMELPLADRVVRWWRRPRTGAARGITTLDGVALDHLRAGTGLTLAITPEWMAWRYESSPGRHYEFAVIGRDSRLDGLAVWRTHVPVGGRLGGVQVTYVMDLLLQDDADPDDTARRLLSAVCAEADARGSVMVVAMASPGSERFALYRAAGFAAMPRRIGWRQPVIVRGDGSERSLGSLADINVSLGMTDIV